MDYISKKPWKFDVTVTLKPAIKNVLSRKIEFELSSVIQEDCPPWVGIFQSLQLLIFVKWIYLLQYSSLDILILGRENNDLLLKELQEEKSLSKIKGGSWKLSQGYKLWETMENILHQIASQLVCTHSPYLRHLPITHCWVVICDHIDTRISVSYKWVGEGFWEICWVRQVVQNPQVLVGGGFDQDPRTSLWIYHGVLSGKMTAFFCDIPLILSFSVI